MRFRLAIGWAALGSNWLYLRRETGLVDMLLKRHTHLRDTVEVLLLDLLTG